MGWLSAVPGVEFGDAECFSTEQTGTVLAHQDRDSLGILGPGVGKDRQHPAPKRHVLFPSF